MSVPNPWMDEVEAGLAEAILDALVGGAEMVGGPVALAAGPLVAAGLGAAFATGLEGSLTTDSLVGQPPCVRSF